MLLTFQPAFPALQASNAIEKWLHKWHLLHKASCLPSNMSAQPGPAGALQAEHIEDCRLKLEKGKQPNTSVMFVMSTSLLLLVFTLVITVSSMMPPFSLVKTLREPVPSASPAMSPTTRVSRKGMASLPCVQHDKQ